MCQRASSRSAACPAGRRPAWPRPSADACAAASPGTARSSRGTAARVRPTDENQLSAMSDTGQRSTRLCSRVQSAGCRTARPRSRAEPKAPVPWRATACRWYSGGGDARMRVRARAAVRDSIPLAEQQSRRGLRRRAEGRALHAASLRRPLRAFEHQAARSAGAARRSGTHAPLRAPLCRHSCHAVSAAPRSHTANGHVGNSTDGRCVRAGVCVLQTEKGLCVVLGVGAGRFWTTHGDLGGFSALRSLRRRRRC